jgi:hypothetical protein
VPGAALGKRRADSSLILRYGENSPAIVCIGKPTHIDLGKPGKDL